MSAIPQPDTQESNRRPQLVAAIVGLSAVLLLWAGLSVFFEQRRQDVIDAAAAESRNLAIALEEQVRRTFLGIDQVLRFTQLADPQSSPSAVAAVASRIVSPGTRARRITVADSRGDVVMAGPQTSGRPNIRDAEYFQAHATRPDVGLFLGRVAKDTGSDEWSMHLSRRLSRSDGSFAGIVATTITPDELADAFAAIDVGRLGSIAAVGRDGFIRARWPRAQDKFDVGLMADTTNAAVLDNILRTSVGTWHVASPLDGLERIFAYRTLTDLPLYVSVGRSLDEVLLPLERERRSGWMFGIACTATIVLAFGLLITELERRRRREAELRAQTDLLAATLDAMDQGLMMIDAAGRVAIHNRRALELLDLPAAFMAARPSFQDVRRQQARQGEYDTADPEFRRWVESDELQPLEQTYERTRPNGTVIEVRSVALSSGGVVRTYSDMTTRRAAEEEIRVREQRLRLLADFGTDMIVHYDLDFVRRYVSTASRHVVGYEPEELVGSRLGHNVDPADAARQFEILAALKAGRMERATVTIRVRRKDLAWIWVESNFGLLRDAAGRPQGIIGTTRDVTDRVHAEQQLHDSEARYRLLAENVTDLVVITDRTGRASYISPAVERMLGYSAEESSTLVPRDLVHPDERARVAGISAGINAGHRDDILTCRLRHKSGRYVWVEAALQHIVRDGKDEIITAIRDIEGRKAAEQTLADKTRILELTLDSMDQGLMTMDADHRVQVYNKRALELLDLPADLLARGPLLAEVAAFQKERGEFVGTDGKYAQWLYAKGLNPDNQLYERERPNGTVLEIRTVTTSDGGAVRTFTDITDRKVAEMRIAHLARHDPLTDLPNRRLFHEHLERALARIERDGGELGLLCLDLDGFKAVNDTLGHPAGDVLLHEVASRLSDVLGPGDVVARLGGDEFAIIQIGAEQPGGADRLARRLIEVVNEPFDISGQPVGVGTSVGIALAPKDGQDTEKLLRNADLALYRAKTEGRNAHRFFEAEMDVQMQARRALELDLKEALNRGEFQLQYQPILDLAENRVIGCEALIRWHHPVRGQVPPGDFIPVAEEAQLIGQIGQWVLREACREAATWPEGLRVAVNLSAAQFRSGGLVLEVASALRVSGLSPDRLELEITETVVMEAASLDMLHQLRALGVLIALDDFGTGYSSLSYLRQFPFDKIKIDRSFIAEIANDDTAAIVRAIVGLGTRLGAVITAEGVETDDQLARVREEGCTEAQGYLIGRPVPGAVLIERLVGGTAQAA